MVFSQPPPKFNFTQAGKVQIQYDNAYINAQDAPETLTKRPDKNRTIPPNSPQKNGHTNAISTEIKATAPHHLRPSQVLR